MSLQQWQDEGGGADNVYDQWQVGLRGWSTELQNDVFRATYLEQTRPRYVVRVHVSVNGKL